MGSERSPMVYYVNAKLEMLLNRDKEFLTKREQFVISRIRAEQKIAYRNFQNRLKWSLMVHAKIIGDKEMEINLRSREREGFNTSIGEAKDDSYTSMLERRASVMLATNNFGTVEMRPSTSVSQIRQKHVKNSKRSPASRAQTAKATLDGRKSLSDSSDKKSHKGLTEYRKKKPTLLDLHLHALENSNYKERFKNIAMEISELAIEDASVSNDYNLQMQMNLGSMSSSKNIEKIDLTYTPVDEIKRCSGNPYIRNLTFEKLVLPKII